MAQVPDVSRQDNIIRRLLRKRAGSEGAQLASVRSMLCTARTYAATQLGMPIDSDRMTRAKLDNAIFPMTTTLAHELIASEDARARKAKAGSQSGATVGARTRDAILCAANRLLWPIDIHKASLESAAEPAQKCVRNKAGTFPIAAKCFLEALASGRHVIATDVGATAALLADAPGCRLIAPSASELTAALADFAAAPPTPRRFDLSRYAWSRIAMDHARLFQRLD